MTTSLPQEGFAKLSVVLAVVPVCRAKWYAGIKSGLYPKPVRLDGRNVAWRVNDIRAVIQRIEQQQNRNSTTG